MTTGRRHDDDQDDETGNISGIVLDQSGNVVDTAMVYFWSVEHDSAFAVEVFFILEGSYIFKRSSILS